MRSFLILSLVLNAALAGPVLAGGRRPAAAASATRVNPIAIVFTSVEGNGSDAYTDAGSISQARAVHGHGRNARAFTTKLFGIRLERAGAPQGTARLLVSLESSDDRCTIRIDGVVITTTPRVIDAQMTIGKTTQHTLEIEVPADMPEGAINAALRWEATTD
ncbi:MAG TPA: hypothetical protein VFN10_04990 [Thermoanaerobaculia bacterium]|nr:hypothetical protein [Thermoanaerobaculia bacterium]